MEKGLEELTASALRYLLIEEVNKFIICLDTGYTDELEAKKLHLKKIFNLITEKEQAEVAPLSWGKNSTQSENINIQSDFMSGNISGPQPG